MDGAIHMLPPTAPRAVPPAGDFPGALRRYEESLALLADGASGGDAAMVVNNMGFVHERAGALGAAAAHYREALRLLAPAGHAQIEANLRNVEGKLAQGA